ncbi:MAG: hypothetical protein US11_C0002G0022 [Candidatus Roizmanbacteria bacterium GW2011_GWA2_36_23]|uniref:ArnT-like N-terminal domain-containing protein n=1 Tax=Candidatus Roizmanbacteria bacterium GW2011_GWA2_36_23 TaxID=1618480 RepID=A0A0G0E4Y5_9BACT|nr:MAG: hypothetical protein US11_C0002G0022 [Candidatus Roizmanbacteria bacterium GW2011_GWA2_36_23]
MKNTSIKFLKNHSPIILFLIFYFSITFYKLVSSPAPFYDWDESIYAQVGREMVTQKSIVPLWQGKIWLDKPPLAPLAYGIIGRTIPVSPEISTRTFTLLLSILILALFYIFYYRLTNNKIVPLLTVIISSFTPIFLQRAQVLNVDVFLLLGWIGYLVFYSNFWLSFIFLSIGVLSKSLLGFYPVIGMALILLIQLYFKQVDSRSFKQQLKSMLAQVAILSLWYLTMLIAYKYAFIKNQFLEAMLKRVTASIESHFGQKTYYIAMIIEQLKLLIFTSVISIVLLGKEFFSKKDVKKTLLLLFFVPWFLFLNLTKTKIAWYIYPVIIQFAFLGSYLLIYLRKYVFVVVLITITTIAIVFNKAFRKNNFFTTLYSAYDQYYELANYAKDHCYEYIEILVDPSTRQTYDVLNKMNLTISTTKWWGNHPAIVYYSKKVVNFTYDKTEFVNNLTSLNPTMCAVISNDESDIKFNKLILLKKFKDVGLYTKSL